MKEDGFLGFLGKIIVSQEVPEFDLGGSAVDEHAAHCDVRCEGSIVEAVSNEGASGSVKTTSALLEKISSNSESNREYKGER